MTPNQARERRLAIKRALLTPLTSEPTLTDSMSAEQWIERAAALHAELSETRRKVRRAVRR